MIIFFVLCQKIKEMRRFIKDKGKEMCYNTTINQRGDFDERH